MESLPNLYYLSFSHLEFIGYEMNPKLLSLFVLNFLKSIYCYGSWIEEFDSIQRLNKKNLLLQEISNNETEQAMLQAGIVLSSGQQQQQQEKKKKKKKAEKKAEEEEKTKKQDDDDDDGNDDPEKKSRLPKEGSGPMLNDIALDILSAIMPIVIANSSIAQTMEILMALTAARAYRTFDTKNISSER